MCTGWSKSGSTYVVLEPGSLHRPLSRLAKRARRVSPLGRARDLLSRSHYRVGWLVRPLGGAGAGHCACGRVRFCRPVRTSVGTSSIEGLIRNGRMLGGYRILSGSLVAIGGCRRVVLASSVKGNIEGIRR